MMMMMIMMIMMMMIMMMMKPTNNRCSSQVTIAATPTNQPIYHVSLVYVQQIFVIFV
jgi:hypothetical protein